MIRTIRSEGREMREMRGGVVHVCLSLRGFVSLTDDSLTLIDTMNSIYMLLDCLF